MTEIQRTNIAVANFIISELHKEKPFDLVLDVGETGALFNIAAATDLTAGMADFIDDLVMGLHKRVSNSTGVILKIDSNADLYYHMLSTYISQHELPKNSIDQFIASGEFDKAFKDVFGLPESVKQSLKEIS